MSLERELKTICENYYEVAGVCQKLLESTHMHDAQLTKEAFSIATTSADTDITKSQMAFKQYDGFLSFDNKESLHMRLYF